MGRELRRVPLDFAHPLNKVWPGFLNPHFKPCPAVAKGECRRGMTAAGIWLDALCSLFAMMGTEAAANTPEQLEHFRRVHRTYPHPYLEEWSQAPREEVPESVNESLRKIEDSRARMEHLAHYLSRHPLQLLPLTQEMVELVQKLAPGTTLDRMAGSEVSFGIYNSILKIAEVDARTWGLCPTCKGDGMDPAASEAYENWKPEPPPSGPGYQLWETVSEGSPISPVFKTEAAFVAYLVREGYSREAAEAFCRDGWAPSGIGTADGTFYKDIESAKLSR